MEKITIRWKKEVTSGSVWHGERIGSSCIGESWPTKTCLHGSSASPSEKRKKKKKEYNKKGKEKEKKTKEKSKKRKPFQKKEKKYWRTQMVVELYQLSSVDHHDDE